ncbi:MAG: vanadium-dependent haloperoxidase [Cellulomonas sp.]
MPTRRGAAAATAAVLLTPLLVAPLAGPAGANPTSAPLASSIAVAWQRTAARTIYTEGGSAPPAGGLYLAFTSLAVHEAARKGQRYGRNAAAAAVATASHDVLSEYFPASAANLDADLTASLAMVPDGKKQDIGVSIGAAAADRMIASRVNDGRNDASVVYSKTPAPGIWQPAPGGAMALPWLGFVDPVVDVAPVALDGPDPLTSAAYATDYNEVRRVGAVDSPLTERSAEQTAIAQFFAANPVLTYRVALCDLLDREPMGLLPTTRMFARIDAAAATSFIQTWRLKFDVGFWRPFQAIALAETDGNPATDPQDGWVPLVANPAYSDYTSGHAAATSPFAEVVRRTLGDHTTLVLRAGGLERTYTTLTALEHDAFHARIWGGLHFRDAMEDGYFLGHVTARRVMRAIH